MEDRKSMLWSCLIGAGAGLIMSLVMLYAMQFNAFAIGNTGFCVLCILALFIPMCAAPAGSRGYRMIPLQFCMVGVSLAVCLLYAYVVGTGGQYGTSGSTLNTLPVILHGISVLGIGLNALIRRRRGE